MATIVPIKTKSGTSWKAIIRRKGHKPLSRTWQTKGEANHWASEQESLILMKRYRDPRLAEAVTIKQALDKYTEHGKTILNKAESTLDREHYSKLNILRILAPETALSEINQLVVYNYQQKRIQEEGSASSIRQELSMLSRMFRIARGSWQLNIDNPVESIDRIPPKPGRERFLSTEEANLVIKEAKNSINNKFPVFVLLLMHTGMRTGEAARIKMSDIDLKNRKVTIWKTKTNKPRTVPLTHEAIASINAIAPEEEGYLFLKPHHRKAKQTMLRPGSIFRRNWISLWKHLKEKAENQKEYPNFPVIPHFTPHDIRHTSASHLLMQGVDIRTIADILGHSTLSMVMRYTHLFDDTKLKHIDKISYLGKE